MKYGTVNEHGQTLYEQMVNLISSGATIKLPAKPVLPLYLMHYVSAYSILVKSKSRLQGIPLSEIKAYLDLFPYTDTDMFITLIMAIDEVVTATQIEKESN